jgi:hypothetical protein
MPPPVYPPHPCGGTAAAAGSAAQGLRRDGEVAVVVEEVRRVRRRRLGGGERRRWREAHLPQRARERVLRRAAAARSLRVAAAAGGGEVRAGGVGDLGNADLEPLAGVEAEKEVGGSVEREDVKVAADRVEALQELRQSRVQCHEWCHKYERFRECSTDWNWGDKAKRCPKAEGPHLFRKKGAFN